MAMLLVFGEWLTMSRGSFLESGSVASNASDPGCRGDEKAQRGWSKKGCGALFSFFFNPDLTNLIMSAVWHLLS